MARKTILQGLDSLGGSVQTFLKANMPYLAAGKHVDQRMGASRRAVGAVDKLRAQESGLKENMKSLSGDARQKAERRLAKTQKALSHAQGLANGHTSALGRAMSVGGAYIAEDPVRAAAVVGGAAVGARLLSGGSLTTNSRGERDIVGVPFL